MLKLAGSPRDYRVVWGWTLLIALIQTCWALAFIYKSSFVVEGRRYFCLFDDAMISMRYGANWAAGHGLVWNPGERVEGYTNFLWTGLMGLLHLLPLSRSHLCLLVQLLNIPILWGCLAGTVLLARASRCLVPSAIAAVILTAVFYNLAFYSLMGMETGLATCLVTCGLAWAVRSANTGVVSWANAMWFLPAVLARPDTLALALLVLAFLLMIVRRGRLSLIAGGLILAGVLAGHLLWRHAYYGEWVPNTYYLKMTNWPIASRLEVGLLGAAKLVAQSCLPCLLALMALLGFRRDILIMAGAVALGFVYHVYVGGDAWPRSRFTIPASPALFVLAALGIRRASSVFTFRSPVSRWVPVCLLVLCVINLNWAQWGHWSFRKPIPTVNGNRQNVRCLHAIERMSEPDASLAVAWAGSVPYFSGRQCYDVLGKCDPVIARLPASPGLNRPGHNKFDLDYMARTHRPDIILHAVATGAKSVTSCYRPVAFDVDGATVGFSTRLDSPRVRGGRPINWKTLAKLVEDE